MVVSVKIGFTGHQGLSERTSQLVEDALHHELRSLNFSVAYCCLAEGADQLFARCVVELGHGLNVIVPCKKYRETFTSKSSLAAYDDLLDRADSRIDMEFIEPSEEAFWAAGKRVVNESSLLLAVWDGEKAGGLGGTADVVRFARERNTPVRVIWPPGSIR
jgi:hypothetical protein